MAEFTTFDEVQAHVEAPILTTRKESGTYATIGVKVLNVRERTITVPNVKFYHKLTFQLQPFDELNPDNFANQPFVRKTKTGIHILKDKGAI